MRGVRVDEWVRQTESMLSKAGIESARTEAQILAAEVLGRDRTWVMAHPEAEIDPSAGDQLRTRRAAREPLAYILGRREFFGREFLVTPDVLIPRQETECVVDLALETVRLAQAKALDLGTGSGCIGVTLALERPGWSVTASDISLAAIGVAKSNAARLGAHVLFTLSDLFEGLVTGPFDAIVTNPPYVENGARLQPEVRHFEPASALFGGPDGMGVYRRIAREASAHLRPGGVLITEVGDRQSAAVREIFVADGWRLDEVRNDLGGSARALLFSKAG